VDNDLRILIVEDSVADAELVTRELVKGGLAHTSKLVKSRDEFLAAFGEYTYDVILCDYKMPGFSAPEALEIIKKSSRETPLIVVSGAIGEDTAVDIMKLGAVDYILKDRLSRLVSAVRRALEMTRVASERDNLRKELERAKETQYQTLVDFVSTVSHELRTPLTVTREAISQVSDGICGEINTEQKQFLFMSIEGIDRLSRLIGNLLDISKIEANKSRLKRELIDVVSLAKKVSSGFALAFQAKGLEIKHEFSKDTIELYADKDRIIQIFVNLMSNAFRFTPAGRIAISIVDKETLVECGVSDTGIGISDQDLSRVFGKFEQFGREYESAAKGTGLGLAISKGIIELHRGQIWAESKFGQGTKISFTLPKYSPRELFREYVCNGVAEAIKTGSSLSVIVFEVGNYDALEKKFGRDRIASIMHGLGSLIKTDLRRKADICIEDGRVILVALPETDRKGVRSTAVRFKARCDDYVSKEGLAKEIEVSLEVAGFPEDAGTEEELLHRIKL
jgi:signal transduction histidine kinase